MKTPHSFFSIPYCLTNGVQFSGGWEGVLMKNEHLIIENPMLMVNARSGYRPERVFFVIVYSFLTTAGR